MRQSQCYLCLGCHSSRLVINACNSVAARRVSRASLKPSHAIAKAAWCCGAVAFVHNGAMLCDARPGLTLICLQDKVPGALRQAVDSASSGSRPMFVAFPDGNAQELSQAVPRGRRGAAGCRARCAAHQATSARADGLYTLVMVDGTWRFAKEIFASARQLLLPPHGPGTQVCLTPPAIANSCERETNGSDSPGSAAALLPQCATRRRAGASPGTAGAQSADELHLPGAGGHHTCSRQAAARCMGPAAHSAGPREPCIEDEASWSSAGPGCCSTLLRSEPMVRSLLRLHHASQRPDSLPCCTQGRIAQTGLVLHLSSCVL